MAIYTTTTILWFLQSLRNIMRTFPAYFHSMVIIFALRSWLKSANCQICFRFLIELIVKISNDPLLRSRAKQFIDFFQNFWLVHLRHQYVIKPEMKKSNGSRQHFWSSYNFLTVFDFGLNVTIFQVFTLKFGKKCNLTKSHCTLCFKSS